MPRAKIVNDNEGRFYGIRYDCPCGSCGSTTLPVSWLPPGAVESPYVQGKPHWSFNGDFERPVFGPSIVSKWEYKGEDGEHDISHVCHSFIGINGAAPGQIVFLGDCTHDKKNTVVDLPELY